LDSPFNADVLVEAVIHIWALGFGAFVIIYTWQGRRQLLAN
jgi:hypothetical protein